jgi:hypothetical protein
MSFGQSLGRFFVGVEPDVADAVLMSCDGSVEAALAALGLPAAVSLDAKLVVGSLVLLPQRCLVVGPDGRDKGFFEHVMLLENFGSYLVGERELFVSSPTYEYVTACDDLTDVLYYASWDGRMTERLETALVELLAACDDSLEEAVGRMKAITAIMGGNDMYEEKISVFAFFLFYQKKGMSLSRLFEKT